MIQSNRKIAGLIKLERREGRKIARKHPEIADLYKGPPEDPNQGLTYREIARRVIPDSNVETGACIVRYAMQSLLSKEELLKYGRLHLKNSFTYETRLKCAANQPLEARVAGGQESARKRGCIPWDNLNELNDIVNMMHDPDYLTPKGVDNKRISREINERYHEGQEVRTVANISKTICRIRKGNVKYLTLNQS